MQIRSLPDLMRTLAVFIWPSAHAHIKAVASLMSRFMMSAPLEIYETRMEVCWIGEGMLKVKLIGVCLLTSSSQMSGLPCIAAMMRGVVWSLSGTSTEQLAALNNI